MRLVSYGPKWQERAGILAGDGIVDLESALRAAGAGVPTFDMRLLLEQPDWRRLLDKAFAARNATTLVDRKSVRLGAPVPVPGRILVSFEPGTTPVATPAVDGTSVGGKAAGGLRTGVGSCLGSCLGF